MCLNGADRKIPPQNLLSPGFAAGFFLYYDDLPNPTIYDSAAEL